MKIRTFYGIAESVDQWVNEFIQEVRMIDIQTHATGNNTIMTIVIYEEGKTGKWKKRLLPRKK